jgi:hypothetical protein
MTFSTAVKPLKSNNSNRRFISLPALCGIMLLYACHHGRTVSSPDPASALEPQAELVTLAKGNYSGIRESRDIAIRTLDEWEELWDKVHHNTRTLPPLPDVDFSSHTILASFLGTRPTGGFGIEIQELTGCGGHLTAIVSVTCPEPGDMVTTALTSPFHIVRAGITGKEIEFIRK